MPTSVPTPVAAVLGVVPTVLDGVRRLPGKAVQLPIFAVSSALTGLDSARREYVALAERGERLLSRMRGTSLDNLGPALGEPPAATPDDEQPKGVPTPKAPQPATTRVDRTRVDSAASPDVVQTVEQVSAVVGGPVVAHEDLPLPDYDHLTLGSLRGRMRSLDLPQLVAVRDYEKAHADRLPIVTMLDNRIAKLASDPTAPLSPGGGAGPAVPVPADGGSKVSPVTAAPTQPTASRGGLGDQNRLR